MAYLYQIYHQLPGLFWTLMILLALIFGSFLNVLIYRLPLMLQKQWLDDSKQFIAEQQQSATPLPSGRFDLFLPRSQCPHCHQPIPIWLNIPIISYLLLRGRSHCCHQPIGQQYLLMELALPILIGFTFLRFGLSYQWLWLCVFCFVILALAVIDLKTMMLPDQLTLPLLWLGLLVNSQHIFVSLNDAVWGAVLGYLFLWSLYWLFRAATGKEGLGYGDFKLLAAIGAWFGWQALPFTLLLSSLAGSVIGIVLILSKKSTRQSAIPFGPFLTLGTLIYLLVGPGLLSYYRTFLGV